jgi:hypothetical protein
VLKGGFKNSDPFQWRKMSGFVTLPGIPSFHDVFRPLLAGDYNFYDLFLPIAYYSETLTNFFGLLLFIVKARQSDCFYVPPLVHSKNS